MADYLDGRDYEGNTGANTLTYILGISPELNIEFEMQDFDLNEYRIALNPISSTGYRLSKIRTVGDDISL